MAWFETWFKNDLAKPINVVQLQGVMFNLDNLANKIGVELEYNGQPAALEGTIAGYVIRNDGTTLNLTTNTGKDGNKAWVILPQEAYTVEGPISIVIKLVYNSAETTIGACAGYVTRSRTSSEIAPTGTVIPSLASLEAAIAAANAAAANAADAVDYIAPTEEESTASAAHAVGSYFIYNGKLMKATSAIAQGAPIVPYASGVTNYNCAEVINGLSGDVYNVTNTANAAANNAADAQQLVAPVESMAGMPTSVATMTHATGSYFVFGGVLYMATSDIAIGDTITTTGTGANAAQVPGGGMGEVADLKSALTDIETKFDKKYGYEFIIGSLNNSGQPVVHPNRLYTPVYQADENLTVDMIPPYRVAIYRYTDSTGTTLSANNDPFSNNHKVPINRNTYFRLVLSSGNSTSEEQAITPELKQQIINNLSVQFEDSLTNIIVKSNAIESVQEPNNFTWLTSPLHNNIFRNRDTIISGLSVKSYYPKSGKTYYVDSINGNDSNGGTAKNPLKTIQAAYEKTDVVIIKLFPGLYLSNNGFNQFITKPIVLSTVGGGKAIITNAPIVFWSRVDGKNNTFTCTRANAKRVIDTNIYDNLTYKEYTLVSSIDDVENTENSYYIDGTNVYIHSETTPNSNIIVTLNAPNCVVRYGDGGVFYAENIDFIGGVGGALAVRNTDITGNTNPVAYLYNCGFYLTDSGSFAGSTNGFSNQGFALTFCEKCVASYNYDDGFNYHQWTDGSGVTIPNAIEIDCIGCNNGVTSGTDNGSTIHDGGNIIRINCLYYGNNGPNIADVGNGTKSWNLACTSNNGNGAAYNTQDGTSMMWLDTCVSNNNQIAVSCGANSVSQILFHNCQMNGKIIIGTNANIFNY